MKKIFTLVLVSVSLLFACASFADNQMNQTPHVAVFKNMPKNAAAKKAASLGYVPHITVYNDSVTQHTLSINSNGALVTAYPGDTVDFFYYNFPPGPQAMTIISDDGAVIFNDYAPDTAILHVLTYESATTTTYQVVFE